MLQAFSDLHYTRPDFACLLDSFKHLNKLLDTVKKDKQKTIIEAYRDLSRQFLEALSMVELGRIRLAQDPDNEYLNQELTLARERLDRAEACYLQTFSLMARKAMDFSEDRLENSAILNEARRVARCYGQVQPELLRSEKDLVREYVSFMTNLHVSIVCDNISDRISDQSFTSKNCKVYLADVDNWLRQARAEHRRKLYFEMAAKLKESAGQVTANFVQLTKTRREQAEITGLDYYNFIHQSQKGYGYSREEVRKFKDHLKHYFLPIVQEIKHLRDERLNDGDPYFYNQFKLAKRNPSDLLSGDQSLEQSVLKACENIFRDKDSYAFTIVREGYWSGDPDLQRRLHKSVILLPGWQILFIALAFQQDRVSLDQDFIHMGQALADLSGLTNLQDLASFKQSNLVRELSGLAMFFLAMRQSNIFCGEDSELFNDINFSNLLMRIPYDLAIDDFETEIYRAGGQRDLNFAGLWQKQERKYSLNQNYGQDGFFSEGNLWQTMDCLYEKPCQALDRVLALVCILAERPHLDRRNSLEKKLNKLLTSNPDLTFIKRLEVSGFASPFDLNTMRRSAFAACDILKL